MVGISDSIVQINAVAMSREDEAEAMMQSKSYNLRCKRLQVIYSRWVKNQIDRDSLVIKKSNGIRAM